VVDRIGTDRIETSSNRTIEQCGSENEHEYEYEREREQEEDDRKRTERGGEEAQKKGSRGERQWKKKRYGRDETEEQSEATCV